MYFLLLSIINVYGKFLNSRLIALNIKYARACGINTAININYNSLMYDDEYTATSRINVVICECCLKVTAVLQIKSFIFYIRADDDR